jgi:hypothetical protein
MAASRVSSGSDGSWTAVSQPRIPADPPAMLSPKRLGLALSSFSSGRGTSAFRSAPAPEHDPITLQLGLALLRAEEFSSSFGSIYADGITLAIVTRLMALQAKCRLPDPGTFQHGLQEDDRPITTCLAALFTIDASVIPAAGRWLSRLGFNASAQQRSAPQRTRLPGPEPN